MRDDQACRTCGRRSDELREQFKMTRQEGYEDGLAAKEKGNAALQASLAEAKDAIRPLIGTHREPCAEPADCPAVQGGKKVLSAPTPDDALQRALDEREAETWDKAKAAASSGACSNCEKYQVYCADQAKFARARAGSTT